MSMKITSESQENGGEEEEKSIAIWDLGSPLYDSYELVSVSYLIERHLMTLPSSGGSSRRHNSKKISPVGPDDQHHLNQAATLVANAAGPRNIRGNSSIVNAWREFVRRKLWRRKMIVGNRKDKSQKLKAGSFAFFNRFASLKK